MQRRFLWICNLVPSSLWKKEFDFEEAKLKFDNDDIIFNTNNIEVDEVQYYNT